MPKIIMLLISVFFASCGKKSVSDCESRICTMNVVIVTVKFKNNSGEPVEIKDYSVLNLRTNQQISSGAGKASGFDGGFFIVVSDSDIKKISKEGDELKVTGTSVETNQVQSAIIKVKGGECACHVEKVSGPDEIRFD